MRQVEWRPVRDFPNYEVSSDGRVRNVVSGREKSIHLSTNGAYMVNLWRDGAHHPKQVHRLQAFVFLSLEDTSLTVNHKNGVRTDNRIENLEVVTQAENNLHKCRVLGKGRGENCWLSKLKDSDIREIRSLRQKGETQTAIARLFKVDQSVVSRICARKTWSHI